LLAPYFETSSKGDLERQNLHLALLTHHLLPLLLYLDLEHKNQELELLSY
jgi:hypothetical protein